MIRLLVSVRNAEESLAALEGGAHLIDIKEPLRGALGAADRSVWREVLAAIAGRAPVSAALGELLQLDPQSLAKETAGLTFVKAGLAGCRDRTDWPQRLRALQEELNSATQLVAVIYADHVAAAAPNPHEVLQVASELGLRTLLIDTFDKQQGDLWRALKPHELRELLWRADECGMQVALAGSLSTASLPQALALAPAWLAVRGAACESGVREGKISGDCVRQLIEIMSEPHDLRQRGKASELKKIQ
ncbi:MAG TPA: (5-formylfuran-3-yl)methyl phosphate synthase [Pirellulaceae bacterium]|nr:(5-formylfuran-3-yl)methyl phosphate synthase [Pirellulaceae bacterium]